MTVQRRPAHVNNPKLPNDISIGMQMKRILIAMSKAI
jgi:hypothetical protein